MLSLLPIYFDWLSDWYMIVYGLLFVALMVVRPQGLIGRSRGGRAGHCCTGSAGWPTRSGRVRPLADPLLRLSGVRKRFQGVEALGDIDLSVAEGTIHGIIGPRTGPARRRC